MADKYIDLDETQIYGPYAEAKIRELVVGQVAEFDAGLEKLATDIHHATGAVKTATQAARKAGAGIRRGGKAKTPVLDQGVRMLGRFSKHLDAHPKGKIDRRTYFPEDGTAGGVGRSATRVLLALARVSGELKKPDCPVRDLATWTAELEDLVTALTPLVEHSDNAKTARTEATPELAAARQAWLGVYTAAKCGVECVLRISGKVHLMPTVFYDLAVSSTTKVTKPPEEPPVE